ncbi:MAG: glycosyl hydrolase family 28-related protein [Rikenellaceae bacterium]
MRKLLCIALLMLLSPSAFAAKIVSLNLKSHYAETIDNYKLTRNAIGDYGLKSSESADQSAALQKAIYDIAEKGGGSLVIPKGTYRFLSVNMASNVHILVDKDAVFKPFMAEGGKSGIMLTFSPKDENSSEYVENCSIRALQSGEKFKVDYSEYSASQKVRFIVARMAKNFLIADANIHDNFTTHCGIVFVPTSAESIDGWKISRPTFGEVRDCAIFNAKAGYGLCQLHGAQSLYFQDIYSNGGVTLRLESGAGGKHAGVFDVEARNVITENGRSAVMMNPHATVNGTVKIDGVLSKGSGIAVLVHGGFVDRKHKYVAGAKPGVYASDSEIVNIKAIYGEQGQTDEKQIYACPPLASEYAKFKMNHYGDPKSFVGPSLVAVLDCTNGNYKVTYKNIISEGFPVKCDEVVYESTIEDRKKRNSEIIESLPAMLNRTAAQKAQYDAAKASKANSQAAQDKARKAATEGKKSNK